MTELPALDKLTCNCCFENIHQDDKFCQSCGFPVKGSEEEQSKFFYNRNFQHMKMQTLNKKIKSAGTTLYVLAGFSLLFGLIYFFINRTEDAASAVLITNAVVAIIFLLLGYWAERKPLASIISGMVLYALLFLIDVIEDPLNIFRGIIIKIMVVSYLIKGLLSALEAEKLKKQYDL